MDIKLADLDQSHDPAMLDVHKDVLRALGA